MDWRSAPDYPILFCFTITALRVFTLNESRKYHFMDALIMPRPYKNPHRPVMELQNRTDIFALTDSESSYSEIYIHTAICPTISLPLRTTTLLLPRRLSNKEVTVCATIAGPLNRSEVSGSGCAVVV